MRISDWSSDVCSSDLGSALAGPRDALALDHHLTRRGAGGRRFQGPQAGRIREGGGIAGKVQLHLHHVPRGPGRLRNDRRSEEPTSELQSPMRTSYAVLFLKQYTDNKMKTKPTHQHINSIH